MKPKLVKMSLSLPGDLVDEMRLEAQRLRRSLSWLAQRSWQVARGHLQNLDAPAFVQPNPSDARPLGRRGPRRRR